MGSERRLNVLVVVEDEGSNAATKAYLAEAGHDAHISTDLEEIDSQLAQRRFDVALLDVSGPESAALALLRRIRTADANIRVIAVTALLDLSDASSTRAVLEGEAFDAVLQHPIDRDELFAAIRSVLTAHESPVDAGTRVTPVEPRRLPAPRPAAQRTLKQIFYNAIHRLPRGRGVAERWVRRIPGLDLPDRGVTVPTVFGTQMRVNPSDNSLEKSVYVRGIYEVPGTQLLLSVLPRVKVFWDVGAHVGYHTLLGSRVIGAGGQVVAFEPHPRVFSLLLQNVEAFGGGNVTLLNMGLSDEDCEQEIFDEGEDVTRAPTFVEGVYQRSGHRCRLRTGDGLVLPSQAGGMGLARPDLIKIDIEGYEDRALKGMAGLLSGAAPPILLFELNRTFNPDPVGLLDFLAVHTGCEFYVERNESRYPIRRSPASGSVPGFAPLRGADIPDQCNVLAVRPDVHAPLLRDP